jgi:hypothetical protein
LQARPGVTSGLSWATAGKYRSRQAREARLRKRLDDWAVGIPPRDAAASSRTRLDSPLSHAETLLPPHTEGSFLMRAGLSRRRLGWRGDLCVRVATVVSYADRVAGQERRLRSFDLGD